MYETYCISIHYHSKIPTNQLLNFFETQMEHAVTNGGVVAAGHQATAEAAALILQDGGNAFDAIVAAMLAACVAEPVLASLGGGGFLTAQAVNTKPIVFDFFVQTPQLKNPLSATNFYPIEADFGTARQVFHIGMGSIATPGFIPGLFAIHRELCRLPLAILVAPAIRLAREGVRINRFQHLISTIVSPILKSTPEAFALNSSPLRKGRLLGPDEIHLQPELADTLANLPTEGEELFYQGELGKQLIDDCEQQGGHLRRNDLLDYSVIRRRPLAYNYRNAKIVSNPLPSVGGTLIAFALNLLEAQNLFSLRPGSAIHLQRLAKTLCMTQLVRRASRDNLAQLLDPTLRQHYSQLQRQSWICSRGTTQISIADRAGNLASMTLSNGEGSGYVLPGSGIMLNNMLGEEDLNPHGFHQWLPNQRIASMMSPTLVFLEDGEIIVTGSGGSNRIRSAILQVISNLVDFKMSLEAAVAYPRIHYENGLLSHEPGFDDQVLKILQKDFPKQQSWKTKSLFFGGAHSVKIGTLEKLSGIGDIRRGGVAMAC
jgi:gamma-glutamyltranspeptidase/glutathione hydrolase